MSIGNALVVENIMGRLDPKDRAQLAASDRFSANVYRNNKAFQTNAARMQQRIDAARALLEWICKSDMYAEAIVTDDPQKAGRLVSMYFFRKDALTVSLRIDADYFTGDIISQIKSVAQTGKLEYVDNSPDDVTIDVCLSSSHDIDTMLECLDVLLLKHPSYTLLVFADVIPPDDDTNERPSYGQLRIQFKQLMLNMGFEDAVSATTNTSSLPTYTNTPVNTNTTNAGRRLRKINLAQDMQGVLGHQNAARKLRDGTLNADRAAERAKILADLQKLHQEDSQAGSAAKKLRPSPSASAMLYAPGTRRKGNDGRMYVVKVTKNGVQRWVACSATSKKFAAARSKKTAEVTLASGDAQVYTITTSLRAVLDDQLKPTAKLCVDRPATAFPSSASKIRSLAEKAVKASKKDIGYLLHGISATQTVKSLFGLLTRERRVRLPVKLASMKHAFDARKHLVTTLCWRVEVPAGVSKPTVAQVRKEMSGALTDGWGEGVEQTARFGPLVACDDNDVCTKITKIKKQRGASEDGQYALLYTLKGAVIDIRRD